MNMLLLAFAAVNPLAFPSYEQEVVAEFATAEEAKAAVCAVAPLPDDAEIAFSCRWDDTNPSDVPKGEMMNRAGVKGNFYFVGNDNPFFAEGPKKLMPMGHAFGNHTIGHPHMMTIAPNAAFRQIAANRIKLEKTIQRTVTSYVSPFGWQTAPLDPDHARTLAASLVASGHFVSQDSRMAWSGLPDRVWMWTNRFNSDDTHPDRRKFIDGFKAMYAAAKKNRDVPRVTLGTHAWCDEKGNAIQEDCLKEFFHPEGSVQMNDWEYGAYRYQYFHGGVARTATDGTKVTFKVKRYAAAYVGDAIPLSLRFSAKPVAVTLRGRALAQAPRGTWTLPQDEDKGLLPEIAVSTGGSLSIVPDETAGTLTVTFVNDTGAALEDVYFAAALPPKWSERRLTASCAGLQPGATFRKTLRMGTVKHPDYAYGTAYYPASVDYTVRDKPHRLWCETSTAPVAIPDTVPAKTARIWGPAEAAKLADVDWAAVSVPGAALPDAANWKRPKCGAEGIWNAVTSPIKVSKGRNGDAALRQLLTEGDHARYVVYDFVSEKDGVRQLRMNYSPKHRLPFICLNGKKMPFTGDGQRIDVRKGANRLLVRADAIAGAYYTDTLYLAIGD